MKKRSAFLIALIFLTSLVILPPATVKAQSQTIIVPDNYPTITAAIGNATASDTIIVRSGTYYENPIIDKPLTLEGENSANTVVVGTGGPAGASVFTITADDVKISNFTIQSLNYSEPTYYATGIIIGGDNCSIVGNNIENVYRGIFVGGWGTLGNLYIGGKSNITISQNNIVGALSDGIRLIGGSSNIISGNNIIGSNASAITNTGWSTVISGNNLQNNRNGIGLGSSNSVVFGNNITGSINWGVYLQTSQNIIAANYIANDHWGVYLSPSFASNNNLFYHNDFINNARGQVYLGSPYDVQVWDDGYPSGGNYWSNYTGVGVKKGPNQNEPGSDGIGDTPFVIGPNATDRYPLMTPFTPNVGTPPKATPPVVPSPDQTCAFWKMDVVEPNGLTPDATGNNPAFLESGNESIVAAVPTLAEGKFGNALNYTAWSQWLFAPVSPSLTFSGDVTIDAWIYVTAFENTTYNDIVTEATRTTAHYDTRTLGLSFNGMSPANGTSGPQGAVCAYAYTSSGYNEIVTTEPVISLNQWFHVVFARSLTTGMSIYVKGVEEPVNVTYGVQNPTGPVIGAQDFYIGHDFKGLIEEVRLSNYDTVSQKPTFWTQWWFWFPFAVALAILAGTVYYVRKHGLKRSACVFLKWLKMVKSPLLTFRSYAKACSLNGTIRRVREQKGEL